VAVAKYQLHAVSAHRANLDNPYRWWHDRRLRASQAFRLAVGAAALRA
jgi:hypothetical protein